MPPKQKFTKEEITAATLNMVRRDGFSGLKARGLGKELGASSRPIFTAFKNMEEVKQETILAARALYNGYMKKGLAEKPAFKGVGMQYIRFAKEEPRLFELLFMTTSQEPMKLDGILPVIDDNSNQILDSIKKEYGFPTEAAKKLYEYLWMTTHGVACLCATGTCDITEDEADEILTEVFVGLLIKYKSSTEGENNA